jgi:hypothetical protein
VRNGLQAKKAVRNIFAAADLVKNDKAEIFRDGWGYLRVRAV